MADATDEGIFHLPWESKASRIVTRCAWPKGGSGRAVVHGRNSLVLFLNISVVSWPMSAQHIQW